MLVGGRRMVAGGRRVGGRQFAVEAAGVGDTAAVGPAEYKQAVVGYAQAETAFVEQAVMEATQCDQVGELRLTAIGHFGSIRDLSFSLEIYHPNGRYRGQSRRQWALIFSFQFYDRFGAYRGRSVPPDSVTL